MPRAHSPLENRTVVVTGAARGLGAAQARALARRGARLALLGHERPDLEAVAASLPTPALAVEADVTDEGALREAAETVRARLGPPSAVVANAGIAEGGPFALQDMASWRRVVDVNLTGSALTAHTFLPDLRQTAGYYLQIASLASLGAAPLMSAYCAAKAACGGLRARAACRGGTPRRRGGHRLHELDRHRSDPGRRPPRRPPRTARPPAAARPARPPRRRRRGTPRPRRGTPQHRRIRARLAASRPTGTARFAVPGAARDPPRPACHGDREAPAPHGPPGRRRPRRPRQPAPRDDRPRPLYSTSPPGRLRSTIRAVSSLWAPAAWRRRSR